jgi:hypothetical protein
MALQGSYQVLHWRVGNCPAVLAGHHPTVYAVDKAAPTSHYMPMLPPEQMQSSMPVYQPEGVWDMTNRQLSRPRTSAQRSY